VTTGSNGSSSRSHTLTGCDICYVEMPSSATKQVDKSKDTSRFVKDIPVTGLGSP
jgi:hypothetical protein